jgi:hypothetical protein
MLLFNLTALSDAQIHRMIWARCLAFGRVEDVSIHRRSTVRPGAFALVDMATAPEVKKVIKGIGDVLFGGSALIQLSQDTLPGDASVVVPLGGPYVLRTARAHDKLQTVVRSWLETSAEYFSEASRAAAIKGCATMTIACIPLVQLRSQVERNSSRVIFGDRRVAWISG